MSQGLSCVRAVLLPRHEKTKEPMCRRKATNPIYVKVLSWHTLYNLLIEPYLLSRALAVATGTNSQNHADLERITSHIAIKHDD